MNQNKNLRRAFSKFTTGIAVVTINDQHQTNYGVTINSFSSLSLDPALVIWSLGDQTFALDKFLNTGHYVVNILSAKQQSVSNNFAAQGEFDRFENLSYSMNGNNVPVLDDCLAIFQCHKFKVDRVGDHWLFVAQVDQFCEFDGDPLIYFSSEYRSLDSMN